MVSGDGWRHIRLWNCLVFVQIHARCAAQYPPECSLGPLAYHILPPTAVCPSVLERCSSNKSPHMSVSNTNVSLAETPTTSTDVTTSHTHLVIRRESQLMNPTNQLQFQICPPPNTRPLLVFINPKSGGKQGERLYRKFQYLLNPRQVYNMAAGGPAQG